MAGKEIAKANTAILPGGLNQEQIELVKRTVARGATNDELALFLYTAQRTGLDPLTKQIHFIKRKVWNSAKKSYDEVGTTQTGIDGYRVIAGRNGLAGIDDAIFDSEEGTNPKKATVTVYKLVDGQRVSFTASARWSEYVAMNNKTNEPTAMWKKMPYLMLAKVAEALALRKAFPNDLSGLYTNEEMAQADDKVVYPAEFDSSTIPANAKAISSGDDLGGDDLRIEKEEDATVEASPSEPVEAQDLTCSDTGKNISQAEYDYSMKYYGKPLSRAAQVNHTKIK